MCSTNGLSNFLYSVRRGERECVKWDVVSCSAHENSCCQSCCLLMASSQGHWGEHFGTCVDQICACSLPCQVVTVHVYVFFYSGKSTCECERVIGELLRSSLGVVRLSWRIPGQTWEKKVCHKGKQYKHHSDSWCVHAKCLLM